MEGAVEMANGFAEVGAGRWLMGRGQPAAFFGKAVRLRRKQTAGAVPGIVSEEFAVIQSTTDTVQKKIPADRFRLLKTPDPRPKLGIRRVSAASEEFSVMAVDPDRFAAPRLPLNTIDRTGKNPRMTAKQRLLPPFLEEQYRIFHFFFPV